MFQIKKVISKSLIYGILFAVLLLPSISQAEETVMFTPQVFAALQKAGEPILLDVHATWCSTCKAQELVLENLSKDKRFTAIKVLRIDFDTQKDVLDTFGVKRQSTLIMFKGDVEVGRSLADTRQKGIAALLSKAL
ncbi:MAG: thioredoxin family protein [Mariprofundales bacterium]